MYRNVHIFFWVGRLFLFRGLYGFIDRHGIIRLTVKKPASNTAVAGRTTKTYGRFLCGDADSFRGDGTPASSNSFLYSVLSGSWMLGHVFSLDALLFSGRENPLPLFQVDAAGLFLCYNIILFFWFDLVLCFIRRLFSGFFLSILWMPKAWKHYSSSSPTVVCSTCGWDLGFLYKMMTVCVFMACLFDTWRV